MTLTLLDCCVGGKPVPVDPSPVSEDQTVRFYQRREFVRRRLQTGEPITSQERREIASLYRVTHSSVFADIIHHTVDFGGATRHVGAGMRRRIKARDGEICQYCGADHPPKCVIDHIVPFTQGGPALEYNLVFACASCNTRKQLCAWVPNNLDAITEHYPEWRARVLAIADHTRR